MTQTEPLLKPIVPFYDIQRPVDWSKQFRKNNVLEVEIGFGLGEVLIRRAKEQPDHNFVGLEQNNERILKTLKAMVREKSKDNIQLLNLDARTAFQRLFNERSMDYVYCLFPCPWPKKRHIKHRLFSWDFLKLVNSRLKNTGRLFIVTDDPAYRKWMIKESGQTGFTLKTKIIQPKFDTKFERKWKTAGKKFYELTFIKKSHKRVHVPRDIVVKSFSLKIFNPQDFHFKDLAGEPTIVYKDYIYDPKKKRAMVCLIVVEEGLTQYVWISIRSGSGKWVVEKAPGQLVFPTAGIAQAVNLVYHAAQRTVK